MSDDEESASKQVSAEVARNAPPAAVDRGSHRHEPVVTGSGVNPMTAIPSLQTLYWVSTHTDGYWHGEGSFTFPGDVPLWLLSEFTHEEPELLSAVPSYAALPPVLLARPLGLQSDDAFEMGISTFTDDGSHGTVGSLLTTSFTAASPYTGSNADVATLAAAVAESGLDVCDRGSCATLTRDTLHMYGRSDHGCDIVFIVTRAASLSDAKRLLERLNKDAVRAHFDEW